MEYEKSGNRVPYISDFEKNLKDAHRNSVQNGCDTFPNELMRFHIEAKPIWDKLKNNVKMQSSVKCGSDLSCRK